MTARLNPAFVIYHLSECNQRAKMRRCCSEASWDNYRLGGNRQIITAGISCVYTGIHFEIWLCPYIFIL